MKRWDSLYLRFILGQGWFQLKAMGKCFLDFNKNANMMADIPCETMFFLLQFREQ